MIGRLRGELALKKPPHLLVDVGGVGYECQASLTTFDQLPEVGQPVSLWTHWVVREDAQLLYGFHQEQERTIFKMLIKISGIGPKIALSILSSMDVSVLLQCIERRDISYLTKIPGIGKKTAERLMVEMTGKNLAEAEGMCFSVIALNGVQGIKAAPGDEAVSALIALGYKPQEASRAVSTISHAHTEQEVNAMSSQALIRKALQGLARA